MLKSVPLFCKIDTMQVKNVPFSIKNQHKPCRLGHITPFHED